MDLTTWIDQATRLGASDLHLAADEVPWVRVDGRLERLDGAAVAVPALALAEALIPWVTAEAHRRWQRSEEQDLALTLPGGQRLRAHLYRQRSSLAASLRLLPSTVPSITGLGLDAIAQRLDACHDGLILVAGATGSGKSSTLAALIGRLNAERAVHIVTLEDPVEYLHPSQRARVTQREIGCDTGGFAQALRSALRQDPDVIVIGELRDLTTIRLALEAASTGHLVLATLHAGSAAASIDRLVEVFDAAEQAFMRTLLAEALRLVVVQRLALRKEGGRVAVRETLVGTPAVRNVIREGRLAQLTSLMQTGAVVGMQTFEQAWEAMRREGAFADSEKEKRVTP